MLTPQIQLVAALFLAGALLVFLGYRIRFRGDVRLITGFECRNVRDPAGWGRWVGGIGIFLGAMTFAAAAIALTRPDLNSILGVAYSNVVLASTAAVVIGSLKHIL
jgi:hypothetical protein